MTKTATGTYMELGGTNDEDYSAAILNVHSVLKSEKCFNCRANIEMDKFLGSIGFELIKFWILDSTN